MSIPDRKTRLATAAELLALPGDVRAELIGGEVVEKSLPSFEHGRAQSRLAASCMQFDRRAGRGGPGGWWIGSEVEIEYETHELYRHDLAGWRRERVSECPRGRPVHVHPDWACEILSPSNWANDTVSKFRTLERHGVPYYWIVDLEHGVLTVYRFGGRVYEVAALARPGEHARLEPFSDVEMEVAVLFGADPAEE